jgi:hypothetical protein
MGSTNAFSTPLNVLKEKLSHSFCEAFAICFRRLCIFSLNWDMHMISSAGPPQKFQDHVDGAQILSGEHFQKHN